MLCSASVTLSAHLKALMNGTATCILSESVYVSASEQLDSISHFVSDVQGALQSFCRKLVWCRECMWPQDLPQHCLIVLEAEDDLVPCKLARTMLHKMKHPCDVRSPLLIDVCADHSSSGHVCEGMF